jgi:IclR family transcriptional regulator, acetate operon repressor
MRLDAAKAKTLLPALQRAAKALSRIDAGAASSDRAQA